MQTKTLRNGGLNCLITEVVTSKARVFVVSDMDNGHASDPTTLQSKQFIRNLISEDVRKEEAVFYICSVPTDLIVHFPCDIPQYMSKRLRCSYLSYMDSLTLLALENIHTLLPFRERPAQVVGKRLLWIDHQVRVGDIVVKSFDIPNSTTGTLRLSIEVDGNKIIIPED